MRNPIRAAIGGGGSSPAIVRRIISRRVDINRIMAEQEGRKAGRQEFKAGIQGGKAGRREFKAGRTKGRPAPAFRPSVCGYGFGQSPVTGCKLTTRKSGIQGVVGALAAGAWAPRGAGAAGPA